MGIFEFILVISVDLLVLILLILAVTKKGRMFAKAAVDSFFTEANKNPKIVAEYFDEKIAQLQKNYEKADNVYQKASGEKLQNERKMKEAKEELERINKSIMKAKKHGNIDDARMYANEAMSIQAELEAMEQNMPVFEEAMKSAGDLRERAREAIQQLKNRKKADIAKAEAGKAAQEIYSQFDESRVSSDIDRILDQFSDYADDQEKIGLGAKASWDSSYEAKKIAAEKRAQQYQADDYIENLVGSFKDNN